MSDVVDEFSTLDGVCERMSDWKRMDPASYQDAFAPICLPKIVSPLVRLQLLFWNPLTVSDQSSVEGMPWFRILALYGSVDEASDEPPEGDEGDKKGIEVDPDRKLLSSVIEKVVVVKITR